MHINWRINASYIEKQLGGFVDWEEEYFICPECGEPIYADDWDEGDFCDSLCPICEFGEEEMEED